MSTGHYTHSRGGYVRVFRVFDRCSEQKVNDFGTSLSKMFDKRLIATITPSCKSRHCATSP